MIKHIKVYAFLFISIKIAFSQSIQPATLFSDSSKHSLEWKIDGIEKSEISSISIDPVTIEVEFKTKEKLCLLYTSPSPRDS